MHFLIGDLCVQELVDTSQIFNDEAMEDGLGQSGLLSGVESGHTRQFSFELIIALSRLTPQ